jgi:hypothetical protein
MINESLSKLEQQRNELIRKAIENNGRLLELEQLK